MESKKEKGAVKKVAPTLLTEWKVIVPFYDLQQRKEVNIGDIVDHTELREELKLIEQA